MVKDQKLPKIPERWANLMKRCGHSDSSHRPKLKKIYELASYEPYSKWSEYYYRLQFEKAEEKRSEMIKSKKLFVKIRDTSIQTLDITVDYRVPCYNLLVQQFQVFNPFNIFLNKIYYLTCRFYRPILHPTILMIALT